MDARVVEVIDGLEQFMEGVDDALPLPRESAAFVHALVLASGAKRGLEIGTSYGYSGLWIASALAENGGGLVTIDSDPRKSGAAAENFERAGLGAHLDIRTGPALEVLPGRTGTFDFVLSDADKINCIRYIELLEGKLADRAVVVTDNTISHADELADFVRWIRGRHGFYSTGVSVGNGLELSIKRSR